MGRVGRFRVLRYLRGGQKRIVGWEDLGREVGGRLGDMELWGFWGFGGFGNQEVIGDFFQDRFSVSSGNVLQACVGWECWEGEGWRW